MEWRKGNKSPQNNKRRKIKNEWNESKTEHYIVHTYIQYQESERDQKSGRSGEVLRIGKFMQCDFLLSTLSSPAVADRQYRSVDKETAKQIVSVTHKSDNMIVYNRNTYPYCLIHFSPISQLP